MSECYENVSIRLFYNISGKKLSETWGTRDVLVMVLGLSVCTICFVANLLVLLAIFINRHFHYPIYYLLGNLAVADFFAGISYMYLMFHTGPFTKDLTVSRWLIRQGLLDTSLTASVANLLAIAVERHQTIFTMQLHSTMTNQRVVIFIIAIWSVAIMMGLIPSLGWNCICSKDNCSHMAPLYSRNYLIFWAVSNLVIFCIMVVAYSHIFIYVRRKTIYMSKHTRNLKHKETMINLMKTVGIILGEY
uniref:Lysophosphatidic acid receptor 2b n=1 Tax=Latimeria chalumnae TaxID=7897 RepID=M3XL84_LATCH|nr:PREDICTED: lysophosphatidic acid receptor 1-A-like [Latimeria chalumnae]|eukprot:XP_006006063.1 PREDICTED: lysophosphatidic acid receptor 1-A-like [Latimeria chalumnae]